MASLTQKNPLEIAIELAACFHQAEHSSATTIEFTIEVFDSGWIYFQLSDRTLAVWLQYLINTCAILLRNTSASASHPIPKTTSQNSLFPIQYAHARCCGLLRLGEQQNLIRLSIDSQTPQVGEPKPIPWLNEQQQLSLVHPMERRLIAQCLRLLDELSQPKRKTSTKLIYKLATELSNITLDFYSTCRIFGEVQRETPQLAQARLGLIAVAKSLLRLMIEEELHSIAPLDL